MRHSTRPYCYMLIGLPGTGKSTYRERLLRAHPHKNFQVLAVDDHVEKVAKRLGKTYNEVFKDVVREAEREMFSKAERALMMRQNVIWDLTNLTRRSREKKLLMVPDDYKKVAIVFLPGKDHNERLKRPGKIIPAEVLNRMAASFAYPTKDEGFDEVCQV